MPKIVSVYPDAQSKIAQGIEFSVRAIRSAFGPRGGSILFHRAPAPPEILCDGLSIARAVIATHPAARAGSLILKEALFELDRASGDGTSTLALIADEIMRGAKTAIRIGHDPGALASALQRGAAMAKAENALHSIRYYQPEHARAIVHTAAMGERQLTDAIARLSEELGADSLITVKEGFGHNITTRTLPGMSLPATHVSELLRGDEPGVADVADVYDNPAVMLVDQNIEEFGKLAPALEGFSRAGKSLIIFCRGLSGPALATLIVNVRENGLKASAIAVPESGSRVFDMLSDLAVLTGAGIVARQTGYSLERFRPYMLGRLDRVEIRSHTSLLFGTAPDPGKFESRREELRAQIKRNATLSLDKERLEMRLARLSGGIGEIFMAAPGAPEQKRLINLARRAVNALAAAQRSGVVAGGGAAYRISATCFANNHADTDTERAAFQLLARALAVPENTLAASLGPTNGRLGMRTQNQNGHPHCVLDLHSAKTVDAFQCGLLDPAELVCEVISRAVSMCTALIRAGVCLADH